MGNSVSVIEYKELLNTLSGKDINNKDPEGIEKLCAYSEDNSDQSMVFTSITSEDIKNLKQNRPMNLLYIIREIIDIMYNKASAYECIEDAQVISVLKGAINLLCKFLPFIIDNKAYMDKIMWEDDEVPYGVKLCESILTLLFKPGFCVRTLPEGSRHTNKRGIDPNVLWANGISTSGDVYNHGYVDFDANRVSLLRLLLVIISQPLYHTSEEYLTILNPFSCFLTCRRASNVKNLFVSLLNIIISYDTEGYRIPYLSSVNTQGLSEKLLEICLSVLLVLIEYKPPTEENLQYLMEGGYLSLKQSYKYFQSKEGKDKNEEKTLSEDLTTNEFHRLLQVIHGKMNLEPFVESIARYFSNLIDSQNTYLPNSVTQIEFYQELYILFWRFIQGNAYFLDEVVSHPEFLSKIYVTVLYHFDSLKKDPTKCNLLYICVFMLLTFSSNRDFSMLLNEPYNLQLEFDLKDFEGGSFADLTYQVIHRMIKAGPGILRPLYKSLVSVLSNTAPYVKGLTKDSCECIFYLIKMFSNPDLLKKREETSRILSNLFEAMNYILLYHDEGNEEFLIALIKYREVLKIGELKLSNAAVEEKKEEVKEIKQEKPKETAKPENAVSKESEKPETKQETKEAAQKPEEIKEDLKEEPSEEKEVGKEKEDNPKQSESENPEDNKEEEKMEETSEDTAPPSQEEQSSSDAKASEEKQETTPTEASEERSEEEKAKEVKDKEVGETKKETETSATTETTKDSPPKEPKNDAKVEESKGEEAKAEDNDGMVDVPLDDIKHQENNAPPAGAHVQKPFLSPEWEEEWKKSLNLINIKHAIQYTDDKARAFLAKNPSPDNNIDADKFLEFLKKSSLKGLLPNQVKILVTTYNGNNSIDTWAISYIWGQVFMRQQEIPIFNVETIKMFKVNYVHDE